MEISAAAPPARPASAARRQAATFAVIGVLSTAAYIALYAVLRHWAAAGVANATALLFTSVGNTAANRRLTFGVRGRTGMARHQFGGLIAFAVALAMTSASIGLLQTTVPRPGRFLELSVLVAANALATIARFLFLRQWIERSPRAAAPRAS
jgi:putative flippase GtrA